MAEALMMKIEADLDSSAFLKQIEELGKQASVKLDAGAGGKAAGKAPEGGGGVISGIKNIFKSLKTGMGFISKIMIGVGIASIILKTMGPVFKMIGMIVTIIAEFFRPISDMLMMLLMPVLSILKPILMIVRTMMAPFKQAAMTGMAAAQQIIGGGMQQIAAGNTEVGAQMLSEGGRGALASASLMFSGFTEMLLGPLADLLGMGEAFDSMMDNWQNAALEGIYTVVQANALVQEIGANISNVDGGALGLAFDGIRARVRELSDSLENGFEIENWQGDLQIVKDDMADVLKPLAGVLSGENLLSNTQDLLTAIEDWGPAADLVAASAVVAAIELGKFQGVMDGLDAGQAGQYKGGGEFAIKDYEKSKVGGFAKTIGMWWSGEKARAKSVVSKDGVGIFDLKGQFALAKAAAVQHGVDVEKENTILANKQLEIVQGMGLSVAEAETAGWMTRLGLAETYVGGSLIPDAEMRGWEYRLAQTELYGGSEGKIPAAFNSGLDTMKGSSEDFGKSMDKVAKVVEKAAKRALKAAKAAEKSAKKAKNSGGGSGFSNLFRKR